MYYMLYSSIDLDGIYGSITVLHLTVASRESCYLSIYWPKVGKL